MATHTYVSAQCGSLAIYVHEIIAVPYLFYFLCVINSERFFLSQSYVRSITARNLTHPFTGMIKYRLQYCMYTCTLEV